MSNANLKSRSVSKVRFPVELVQESPRDEIVSSPFPPEEGIPSAVNPEGSALLSQQPEDQDNIPIEDKKAARKRKKEKREKLMSDKPLKFKAISFENVMTDEEKAARKKGKKEAKKKGSPKRDIIKVDEKKEEPKEETKEGEQGIKDEAKESTAKVEKGKKSKKKDKKDDTPKSSTVKLIEKESKEQLAEGEKKSTSIPESKGKEKGKKGKKKIKAKKEAPEISQTIEGQKPEDGETAEYSEKEKPAKGGKKKGKKEKGKAKKKETGETTEVEEIGEESEGKKIQKKKGKAQKSTSFLAATKSLSSTRTRSRSMSRDLRKSRRTTSETTTESFRSGASKSSDSFAHVSSIRFKFKKKKRRSKTKSATGYSLFSFSEESLGTLDEAMKSEVLKKKKTANKEKKGKNEKKAKKEKEHAEPKEVPTSVEKPPEEPAKKEKKGKKKKGKKEPEVLVTPDESEPVDIIAQIRKMKEQADAEAGLVTTDETAPTEEAHVKKKKKKKGKKGAKKKLTKAEKTRMEHERAEQARLQAELDAQRAIEEERIRLEQEKKMAKEKEKREAAEQALRVQQLTDSNTLIKNILEHCWTVNSNEKAAFEWEQYLKCDGLPDPKSPAEMNTYLHLWDQVINDVSVEESKHRTNEIIELLQVLQDFIDDPFDAATSLVADWKWVRALCREHQQENLDMATYRLLRDIDSRLNRIDIPTADYNIIDENFMLCLWLYVQLATPMYNPRASQKKRLEIDFPDMRMNVLFPQALESKCIAIRTIYVKYDHLSDTCSTYDKPEMPLELDQDLFDSTAREWYSKMKYKWDNKPPPPKKMIQDEEGNTIEIEELAPQLAEGEMPPPVPYQKLDPSASQYTLNLEDEMYSKNRDNLRVAVDDKVVNLRRFLIVGGIYHLDIFYQPPQPHDQVAFEIRITALQVPKRLYEVPLYIPYNVSQGPQDPEVRKQPEELEEELKQQEAELDKLILITLTLPDHVIFLDLPTVCHWDKYRKVWTTEDVYDLKHIEEKNYMTFRTGRFGPFALAINRYINFPFQAWEIKPESDGTVTFQLTCAILMVEFNVKDNRICMTQLQNSPNMALQDIIGIYYKLPKLIRVLQNGGIDLFPATDAFCYMEGTCEKHWPTEKHLYYNMAILSPSYNFAWSRWNNQAGRRNLVLQMREYRLDRPKQKNHSMLLVTPLKVNLIETTEVSQVFNDTPTESMKFYSDLYNLMKGTSTMATRNKVLGGPQTVANTLADLLIATRVMSFS